MTETLVVHIVDDDAALRDATEMMLAASGYTCRQYASASDFLGDAAATRPGCALIDIRMPGMDGLTLQKELVERGILLPLIFLTGYADVPLAVEAMKAGAVDFVEKPCPPEVLKSAIERALALARQGMSQVSQAQEARARFSRLTAREMDVLECLVAGDLNKITAYKLGISPRTVELHRARVMEKVRVKTLAELVRLAMAAGPALRENA